MWQLELTTQIKSTNVVGCKGTKPEYGLMDTWLDGSVCKMHIQQLLLVLSWSLAAHNNSFFVEHLAAATRNISHLGHLKQNLKFPEPNNIGVEL